MDTSPLAENNATPWDPADPNPPPIPTEQGPSANVATPQGDPLENNNPSSPADTPASETQSQEEQASQELFTPAPSAPPAVEQTAEDTRKRPPSSPVKNSHSVKRTPKTQTPTQTLKTTTSIPATSTVFLRHFIQGIWREGTERVILTPYLAKDKFTELCALYLHQDKGEYENVDPELVKKKGWPLEVIAQWKLLQGKIRKDSYAKFVE